MLITGELSEVLWASLWKKNRQIEDGGAYWLIDLWCLKSIKEITKLNKIDKGWEKLLILWKYVHILWLKWFQKLCNNGAIKSYGWLKKNNVKMPVLYGGYNAWDELIVR